MRFEVDRGIGIVGGGSKLWLVRDGQTISPDMTNLILPLFADLVTSISMMLAASHCSCKVDTIL